MINKFYQMGLGRTCQQSCFHRIRCSHRQLLNKVILLPSYVTFKHHCISLATLHAYFLFRLLKIKFSKNYNEKCLVKWPLFSECSCKEESPTVVKKEEKVLRELFGPEIRCCARNELGRECTKLFTIGNPPAPQAFAFSDYSLETTQD